jgi:hypothetical protein
MDDQKLEETAFTALAVMEEAAKVTKEIQRSAEDALTRLPEAARRTFETVARETFAETAQKASEGLLEASSEAKASASALRRTGLMQGVFLLAVGVVIIGALYFVAQMLFDSRVTELAELKAAIRAEEGTLAELRSKTWGLELVNYGDGTRGILLPKGIKIDRTGAMQDGRAAIVIKP